MELLQGISGKERHKCLITILSADPCGPWVGRGGVKGAISLYMSWILHGAAISYVVSCESPGFIDLQVGGGQVNV